MLSNDPIILFHSPQSRSAATRTLLEELGAPYRLRILNMKMGEQRQAPYLAINPLGKVPAIHHRGALVTEQVAIFLYLADLFPEMGLTPALNDPRRGPYLRWMVYYAACYEPALVDRAMKREQAPLAMSPYGAFDTMHDAITGQLSKSAYFLGEDITAVDILWGLALKWGAMFGILPANAIVADYVKRVTARPAFAKVEAMDAELALGHEAEKARAAAAAQEVAQR
ncbi:glutathione S-transferase family protein [Methylocapsa sp. S129]|uniref:glutathione S-transferase family protein n=1 Tax=Methylocapsa sp. S129 TaxID=1641869 RepID=UPI00131BDC67|nr:glutathione S-transferase family protein [Methylocapsa sp. S129]